MSTSTINSTTPSAAVNFAVLRNLCDKLLEMSRRNQIVLGKDEYQLVWNVVYANGDGSTATGTSTAAAITY